MKRMGFLAKLSSKGKLELVEPSLEISESYRLKSDSYIDSSRLLLKNQKLEEDVSMAYYSMYYMALSLLFKTGIKCENHTATILILKEIFGINNKDIMFAKKERIDNQYYVDFKVTESDVEDLIEKASEFRKELYDFISKLTSDTVEKYKVKLKSLL